MQEANPPWAGQAASQGRAGQVLGQKGRLWCVLLAGQVPGQGMRQGCSAHILEKVGFSLELQHCNDVHLTHPENLIIIVCVVF